ncbi:hypothetical protein GCM10023237_36770 [Streptomyces coeruleoprunus]
MAGSRATVPRLAIVAVYVLVGVSGAVVMHRLLPSVPLLLALVICLWPGVVVLVRTRMHRH